MRSDDGLVVDRVDLIDAAWLTAVLAPRFGTLDVADLAVTPVGTGQMGASYRVRAAFAATSEARNGPVPDSFVVKLPNPDPSSRAMAAGAYRTEVSFYREIASTLPVRTPDCFFAAISDRGEEFVLVLEDLAPAVQGDQLAGCSGPAAIDAVVNLARLHGPRWCDPTLDHHVWLARPDPEEADVLADVMGTATETFTTRFADRISPQDRATLELVPEIVGDWVVGRAERFALVHGDYRLDNLMFPADGAAGVAALDWQTLSIGLPARDLAYFVGTSLAPDERRASERELVEAYRDELSRLGVSGYSADACFDDYRFGALQGPVIIVLGAAYGTPTPRGDEMFLAMTARACSTIRELDTVGAIARRG